MHSFRQGWSVLALVVSAAASNAFADEFWTFVNEMPADHVGEAWVRPTRGQALLLDFDALEAHLKAAPAESLQGAVDSEFVIELPTPDGGMQRFALVYSPVMAPELAAEFPAIRTYLGQGIDDPAATLRADTTPAGFHAQVLGPGDSWYIDPYTRGDNVAYTSHYKRDLTPPGDFSCTVFEPDGLHDLPPELKGLRSSGGTRREYRLAVAATGEYTAFQGGTVTAGQAAIVTAINRVTGVYEIECAIRLILVANNSLLVYTNSASDPYTNSNGGTMLGQNVSNINAVIGSANYDIGHVFSTGGGGVAYLGVVCTSSKAGGVTGLGAPTGDAFYIDYVAHEMGHQFGANHSFNGVASSCSGNRASSAAYEPGSASTIMGYAGICGVDDLQAHSDAYFVHKSYDEILAYVGAGSSCEASITTGNTVPTVNAGPDYTIPKQTPFTLTASGSDPDGDTLTYCWEQRDLGVSQDAVGSIFADNGDSPFLRSWLPTSDPTRTIPKPANLRANTFPKGEQLPNLSTSVNFRVTVRDNRAGNGGVNTDDMKLTIATGAGPFLVTSPNTSATVHPGPYTVTWDVANTTASPVNCASVSILLSTDGGVTFPTALSALTANDGSEVVVIPNVATSQGRIMVASVGNIFFDISNANFTIAACDDPVLTQQPASQTVTAGSLVSFMVGVDTAAYSFQWRKGGVNLNDTANVVGTHSGAMFILAAAEADEGSYDCIVTRLTSGCYTISNPATLTVNAVGGCPNQQTGCTNSDLFPAVTQDCVVDLSDLGQLLANYGPGVGGKTRAQGDIYPLGGGDGFVDLSDLGQLLADFGTDCR